LCLKAKDLIRLNYRYPLTLAAIVLCNESLHPSLPRACWGSNDDEGMLVRNNSGSNCSLILAVAILLCVLTHCLRHIDHLLKRQWLCYL
jgi:hypothetical protein